MSRIAIKTPPRRGGIAKDVMTAPAITVKETDTLAQAQQLLESHNIRHLPVVAGKEVVGVLSDRDVNYLKGLYGRGMLGVSRVNDIRVKEVMTTDFISVTAEVPVVEVINLLLDHQVGALPVVQAESEELLGVVSYVDLLSHFQQYLLTENLGHRTREAVVNIEKS